MEETTDVAVAEEEMTFGDKVAIAGVCSIAAILIEKYVTIGYKAAKAAYKLKKTTV